MLLRLEAVPLTIDLDAGLIFANPIDSGPVFVRLLARKIQRYLGIIGNRMRFLFVTVLKCIGKGLVRRCAVNANLAPGNRRCSIQSDTVAAIAHTVRGKGVCERLACKAVQLVLIDRDGPLYNLIFNAVDHFGLVRCAGLFDPVILRKLFDYQLLFNGLVVLAC